MQAGAATGHVDAGAIGAPKAVVPDPAHAIGHMVQQAEGEQSASWSRLAGDQAAAKRTQGEIDRVKHGASPDRARQTQALMAEASGQQKQIAAEQKHVDAAGARIAVGHAVLGSGRAGADHAVAVQSRAQMLHAHQGLAAAKITLKPGEVLAPDKAAALPPRQKAAYDAYATAQAHASLDALRAQCSAAHARQAWADFGTYRSDPAHYGTAAADAVRAADAVLGKSGLKPLPLPPAAGRDVAYADLQDARRAAAHLDAAYSLADTVETARRPNADVAAAQHAADQVLAQAGGKVPEGRSPLAARWYGSQHALRTAQDKAVLPNAWVDRSAARLQQVEADQALDHANQAFSQARTPAALAQAQAGLGWAQRRAKAAAALEGGASAQVHAAETGRPEDKAAATTQVLAANKQAADLHADQAMAGLQAARRAAAAAPGNKAAQQELAAAQRQVDAAQRLRQRVQYAQDLDGFQRGLPANLKAPRTEDDKQKLEAAQQDFLERHSFGYGSVRTGADGLAEIEADTRDEAHHLQQRGWMQSAADGVSGRMGYTRSEYEHFLQTGGKKASDALRQLEADHKSGKLSDGQYDRRVRTVMVGYEGSKTELLGAEHEIDGRWDTAQSVFRDAAAITVGIAATAGSGFNPLVGTAAGFATYQALDAVQNVVTTERGGDLRENDHVSLIGLGISAYHGKLDRAELKHAALDAGVEGVSAFTNAVGANVARATTVGVTARITAKFGEQGAKSLLSRATAGATSAVTSQVIQSVGTVANTTLTLASQNKLGTAEGHAALRTVLRDQVFSTVTSGVGGGIASTVPSHSLVKQAGMAFGQNVFQSEVHARMFDQRDLTVKDAIGAFIGAVPTAAHHLVGHPDRQIARQPDEARSTPGPKKPGQDHAAPTGDGARAAGGTEKAASAGTAGVEAGGVKAGGTEAANRAPAAPSTMRKPAAVAAPPAAGTPVAAGATRADHAATQDVSGGKSGGAKPAGDERVPADRTPARLAAGGGAEPPSPQGRPTGPGATAAGTPDQMPAPEHGTPPTAAGRNGAGAEPPKPPARATSRAAAKTVASSSKPELASQAPRIAETKPAYLGKDAAPAPPNPSGTPGPVDPATPVQAVGTTPPVVPPDDLAPYEWIRTMNGPPGTPPRGNTLQSAYDVARRLATGETTSIAIPTDEVMVARGQTDEIAKLFGSGFRQEDLSTAYGYLLTREEGTHAVVVGIPAQSEPAQAWNAVVRYDPLTNSKEVVWLDGHIGADGFHNNMNFPEVGIAFMGKVGDGIFRPELIASMGARADARAAAMANSITGSGRAARYAEALAMTEKFGDATSTDTKLVLNALAKHVPTTQLRALRAKTIRFFVGRDSIVGRAPEAKGGPSELATASYNGATREAIIPTNVSREALEKNVPRGAAEADAAGEAAEEKLVRRTLPYGTLPDAQKTLLSVHAVLHETGHAIDTNLYGGSELNALSKQPAFLEAFAKDEKAIQLNIGGDKASETFAEYYARFLVQPEEMKLTTPNLHRYYKSLFQQPVLQKSVPTAGAALSE